MDWKEKITDGMRLIKEGCRENHELCGEQCPFDEFCLVLWHNDKGTPDDWMWGQK